MKNKKNAKIYGLCIGMMSVFVVIALFFPQIVFRIQDSYQMRNTETKVRSDVNVLQVNSVYEKQMNDRMRKLADLQDSAIVTVLDCEMEEEGQINKFVESLYEQEWIKMLNDMTLGVSQELIGRGYVEVENCKKYIVYGDDYQEGVILMLWYLDIAIPENGVRVRFLVDSETESIYYIKITECIVKDNSVQSQTESQGNINDIELLKIMAESACERLAFYAEYYEAEIDKMIEYDEENGYVSVGVDDNICEVAYVLPYKKNSLDLMFQVSYENSMEPNILLGISVIGNLIPEMMQD